MLQVPVRELVQEPVQVQQLVLVLLVGSERELAQAQVGSSRYSLVARRAIRRRLPQPQLLRPIQRAARASVPNQMCRLSALVQPNFDLPDAEARHRHRRPESSATLLRARSLLPPSSHIARQGFSRDTA